MKNRLAPVLSWQAGQLAKTYPLFSTSGGAEYWHMMNRFALALKRTKTDTHIHAIVHILNALLTEASF